MKRIWTIMFSVIMGAAFLFVPAVSFGAEEDAYQTDETAVIAEEEAQPADQEVVTEEPAAEEPAADEQAADMEQLQRNQVVEAAQSQEGYLKGDGDDVYTLKARELGYSAVNGWCGRFVWWCFYTTGNASAYYDGAYTGSPQKLIDWARANDRLIDSSQALPGDIMIKMYTGNTPHAGIIESIDSDGTIHSIERNHYKRDDGVYRFTRPGADYIIRPQYGE